MTDTKYARELQEKMKMEIKKEKFLERGQSGSDHDFFSQAEFVYNLAFVELTKQVSTHCSERGSLMSDLWTAFNSLFAD
jgi:hypothetical protein